MRCAITAREGIEATAIIAEENTMATAATMGTMGITGITGIMVTMTTIRPAIATTGIPMGMITTTTTMTFWGRSY